MEEGPRSAPELKLCDERGCGRLAASGARRCCTHCPLAHSELPGARAEPPASASGGTASASGGTVRPTGVPSNQPLLGRAPEGTGELPRGPGRGAGAGAQSRPVEEPATVLKEPQPLARCKDKGKVPTVAELKERLRMAEKSAADIAAERGLLAEIRHIRDTFNYYSRGIAVLEGKPPPGLASDTESAASRSSSRPSHRETSRRGTPLSSDDSPASGGLTSKRSPLGGQREWRVLPPLHEHSEYLGAPTSTCAGSQITLAASGATMYCGVGGGQEHGRFAYEFGRSDLHRCDGSASSHPCSISNANR